MGIFSKTGNGYGSSRQRGVLRAAEIRTTGSGAMLPKPERDREYPEFGVMCPCLPATLSTMARISS